MNKDVRIALIVAVGLVGAALLLWTGFFVGRNTRVFWGDWQSEVMPRSMSDGMGSYRSWNRDHRGPGMMGRRRPMHGRGRSWMPRGGAGMRDRFKRESAVDPLSVTEAQEAVETYLDSIQAQGLVLEEIMIFSNHGYAIVVEESSGMGAFELLVDPVTGEAFPEYGPNMMWNLKYGMMRGPGGSGMRGPGMMGGRYGSTPGEIEESGELSVSPDEALQAAQRYLDEHAPGSEVSDEITQFYGYYTIDVERDGEITGMVSVNGYTSQVFPHTWHGEFIEMSEK